MWKKRKRRALMRTPRNLLLGEPSLGPAPTFVHLIYQIILEINRQDVAILFVEHNARQALRLARRGYVLETGVHLPGRIITGTAVRQTDPGGLSWRYWPRRLLRSQYRPERGYGRGTWTSCAGCAAENRPILIVHRR